MSGQFIKLPIEALCDERLGDRDRRVLMALYSFGANPGDVVFPSRDRLCQLARLHPQHVSAAVTRLEKMGWIIRKQGSNGPNVYTLLCPVLSPKVVDKARDSHRFGDVTVTDLGTVTDSVLGMTVTDTVSDSHRFGDVTVTDLGTVTDSVLGMTVTDTVSDSHRFGDVTVTETVTQNRPRTDQEQTKEIPNVGHDEKSSRAGKCFMVPDWEPSPSLMADFERLGIDRRFALDRLPEFRRYWMERKEQRPGWDRTFLNRVQSAWEQRTRGGTVPVVAAVQPSGFRTWGEQRQDRNVSVALDWAKKTERGNA